MGEISEPLFQVQRRSHPLIYFWCGSVARAGRFNKFSRSLFSGQFSNACLSQLGERPTSSTRARYVERSSHFSSRGLIIV